MSHFTPWSALGGGALIGLACALLLLVHGKVAGISGICAGFLRFDRGDFAWRAWFLAGMVVTAVVLARVMPGAYVNSVPRSTGVLIAAGLLVGVGTRLGNGCTSGHGLCGTSRLSKRSIVATVVFMLLGMASATVAARWLVHA
ncbi:MAG: putative transrane protein [Myxococcales bacterium]|nr:putative transrane protein [Myxococcales bacterium]